MTIRKAMGLSGCTGSGSTAGFPALSVFSCDQGLPPVSTGPWLSSAGAWKGVVTTQSGSGGSTGKALWNRSMYAAWRTESVQCSHSRRLRSSPGETTGTKSIRRSSERNGYAWKRYRVRRSISSIGVPANVSGRNSASSASRASRAARSAWWYSTAAFRLTAATCALKPPPDSTVVTQCSSMSSALARIIGVDSATSLSVGQRLRSSRRSSSLRSLTRSSKRRSRPSWSRTVPSPVRPS